MAQQQMPRTSRDAWKALLSSGTHQRGDTNTPQHPKKNQNLGCIGLLPGLHQPSSPPPPPPPRFFPKDLALAAFLVRLASKPSSMFQRYLVFVFHVFFSDFGIGPVRCTRERSQGRDAREGCEGGVVKRDSVLSVRGGLVHAQTPARVTTSGTHPF